MHFRATVRNAFHAIIESHTVEAAPNGRYNPSGWPAIAAIVVVCCNCTGAAIHEDKGIGGPRSVTTTALPSCGRSMLEVVDTAEQSLREVVNVDLPCSMQQPYIHRVLGQGDVILGGEFEFYGVERCGSYQAYRVSKDRIVVPEGIDIFMVSRVSPGNLAIVTVPAYATRPPSQGETVSILGKEGVLCTSLVGNRVPETKDAWTIDGCASRSPVPYGSVAVITSQTTPRARLETQSFMAPALSSEWKPFVVVNLTGDRKREIVVSCRHGGYVKYECERFMVYRENPTDPGWAIPVARARWTPNHSQ